MKERMKHNRRMRSRFTGCIIGVVIAFMLFSSIVPGKVKADETDVSYGQDFDGTLAGAADEKFGEASGEETDDETGGTLGEETDGETPEESVETPDGSIIDSEEPVVIDGGTKTVWLKGDKKHSKITLETSLVPSTYTDSKGNLKAGKIGFVVMSVDRGVKFDTRKHKVLTKNDKKTASVTSKGVVSGKRAGTAYVYAYDTGSFKTEKYTINVLTAPKKIYLSDEPGVTDKENLIKKLTVYPDESEPVYIVETAGDSVVDPAATYSIVIEEEGNSGITTTEVFREKNGTLWFDVIAAEKPLNAEKATEAKITVINNESGKKASLTAFLPNPIESMSITGEGTLKKKGDSVRLRVTYITPFEEGHRTTDIVKPYVSITEPDIDEKKITYEKASEIKVKWEPKTGLLVVTAAKRIEEGGSVWFLVKNKYGEAYFEYICTVDETGALTVNPRFAG